MAAEPWTAQLHIVAGEASEEAPEMAYAERLDSRGLPARLYIVAEPDRPGSDQFIAQLVDRIGEDFKAHEGSLTGVLQRSLRQWHNDLLDWNRSSIPRNQASYGLSCLIMREPDVFLAQIGPSLAYYRQGEQLLRRRPATERAATALGGAEIVAPEFSQLEIGPGDWALLINSGAASVIGDATLASLRQMEAEDVLPALYPLLRPLPRVSALVVAPAREEASLREPVPVDPAAARHDREARDREAVATETGRREGATPADRPSPPAAEPVAVDEAAEAENVPERTPVSEAVGAWLGGLGDAVGRLLRRRRRPDIWSDEAQPPASAAAGGTPSAEAVQSATVSVEEGPLEEEPGKAEPLPEERLPEEPAPEEEESAGPDEPPSAPPSASAASPGPGESGDAAPPAASPDAGASEGGQPPEAAGKADEGYERIALNFAPASASGPGREPALAAWPGNPFAPPPPQVLESALEVDASRLSRPLFSLRASTPRLRLRAPSWPRPDDAGAEGEPGWRQHWGAITLGLGAMLLVLAIVAAALLVPDLLEDSERSRFEQHLEEARRAVTAATLTNEPGASRDELTVAEAAIARALALRPLDTAALALQQDVAAALRQANAILAPAELALVLDFGERAAQPLALSAVQVGGEHLYVLDESGGRIFALALAGGDPGVIFRAGERYPLIFEFNGPEAAAPISMEWSAEAGAGVEGASLTILDANRRLFRYTPATGVVALDLPNSDVLGSADAVTVRDRSLYVLDRAGGIVWQIPVLSDGDLAPGAPAIQRTDLAAATALVVDEAIFVSGSDGRIRRLSESGDQGFPVPELDRPLLVPASLAVGQTSGLLYAVDRGNNRVVIFTTRGELVAQLRADLLIGVRAVVPDEVNRRLYYATEDALLTSALPEELLR